MERPMKLLTILLVNTLTGSGFIFDNKHTLRFDGEVNIGLLVDLHNDGNATQPSKDGQCNKIDPQVVQQVVAASWAIDVINNQSLPSDLKIDWHGSGDGYDRNIQGRFMRLISDAPGDKRRGKKATLRLQILDTCGSVLIAQKQLFNLITSTRDPIGSVPELPTLGPPILGVVGIGKVGLRSDTTGALHAFNIPLLSIGPEQPNDEMLEKYENMVSTAPDFVAEAKALSNIVFEMNVEKVFLVTSKKGFQKTFEAECDTYGIKIEKTLVFDVDTSYLSEIYDFLIAMRGFVDPVIVLSAEVEEVLRIAERISKIQDPLPLWLIGSVGLHLKKNIVWKKTFHGGLLVEPHMPELEEFKNFFLKSLRTPPPAISVIMNNYIKEVESKQCPINKSSKAKCKENIETFRSSFEPDPYVSFMVKAISAVAAAFRLSQLDHCLEDWKASCLRKVHPGLHSDIVRNLRRLSFTSMTSTTKDQQALTSTHHHHFTQNGRLVTQIQQIYSIDEQANEIEQIGWFTVQDGLNIDLNDISLETDYNLGLLPLTSVQKPLPATTTTTTTLKSLTLSDTTLRSSASMSSSRPFAYSSQLNPTTWKPAVVKSSVDRSAHSRSIAQDNQEDLLSSKLNSSYNFQVTIPVPSFESSIGRTWALTILSISLLGIFVALWMIIYVTIKICDGTIGGSQTMGLVLLLGVIFLLTSVIPWLLPPNEAMCAVRYFLPPISLSLNFAVLLVKIMQLQSLAKVGIGGSIPQVNQLVSLLFMVAVQVVISSEWYISNGPILIAQDSETSYVSCNVSQAQFVLLFSYPSVLLVFTFCFGISVLKIKANYDEGRWITAATITIMPIYIVWMLLCSFAPIHFHDASTSFAIVIIGLLILCIVFAPKMHTIVQEGKKSAEKNYRKQFSHQNIYNTSNLSDSTLYNVQLPRHKISKHHSSYAYSPTMYFQKEQRAEVSNTVPFPKRQQKSKVVHIHGTNGAKFNGLNFISSIPKGYPEERDQNGTVYEDDWWTSPIKEKQSHLKKYHETSQKHRKVSKDSQSCHQSHKSHSNTPEQDIFQKVNQPQRIHEGPKMVDKVPSCFSGTSTTSSTEKKSFGCTVKGSSAIVLAPDSLVYNDNGIWSHRYYSSK